MFNKYGHAGGIVANIYGHGYKGDLNFENCEVYNTKIYGGENQYGSNTSAGVLGGILGTCQGRKLKFKNCVVDNFEIDDGLGNRGGILGDIESFDDVEIDKCIVTNFKARGTTNYTGGNSTLCEGGIAGYLGTTGNRKIANCKLNNVELTNLDEYGQLGGIVGCISSGNIELAGCEVKNIKLEFTANTNREKNEWTPEGGSGGGLIGYVVCAMCEISNCDVIGLKVNSVYGNSGGILGGIVLDNYEENSNRMNISNCNVENLELEAWKYTGGISGVIYGRLNAIVHLNSSNVKNSELKGNKVAGGLVGTIYINDTSEEIATNENLDLTNNRILNTMIKGKDKYNYVLGWNYPENRQPVLTSTSYDSQTTKGTY